MLIRSQDKLELVNMDRISKIMVSAAWENDSDYYIMAADDVNGASIGTYSSEARAIKVLDMIQQRAEVCAYMKLMSTDDMYAYIDRTDCNPYKAFQMPQDGEVEG